MNEKDCKKQNPKSILWLGEGHTIVIKDHYGKELAKVTNEVRG